MKTLRSFRTLVIAGLCLALAAAEAFAQTAVKPGFNLFTTQQDVEIGRQSAAQVERQIPVLHQPAAARYVSRIGARLAQAAPGAKYPYQFKVVNLSDVNAFALPGGYIYIHRGLIEHARTEGELASVVAHEIAHVALRHQTNQVSKAYLAQAGVGILGGLIGGKSKSRDQVMQAVGGFGLNALFMKFSRSAEQQADIVGAQTMARAGYDPTEMARFFELLSKESGRNPGKVAQFFSDHPSPADRATRIRREASLIGPVRGTSPVGNIAVAQAELRGLPRAQALAQVARVQSATGAGATSISSGERPSYERPSDRYRVYRQSRGLFEIQYPGNWRAYATAYGATLAPSDGVVQSSGRQELRSGVIVNHYVPFDGAVGTGYRDPRGSLFGDASLEQATSDLVRQIMRANPYLKPVAGSARRGTISGQRSLSVVLAGAPGGTRSEDRLRVAARELPDGHVIYVLAMAPAGEYSAMAPTFDRMIRSLRVNEGAIHD